MASKTIPAPAPEDNYVVNLRWIERPGDPPRTHSFRVSAAKPPTQYLDSALLEMVHLGGDAVLQAEYWMRVEIDAQDGIRPP